MVGDILNEGEGKATYSLKCSTVNKGSFTQDQSTANDDLSLAPIQFSCGSFEDPYEYIGDADVIFVFSTCWTPDLMKSLSECIGRQCKPGTIAITTEFQMPLLGRIDKVEGDDEFPTGEYELEVVEKVDGYCGVTGGTSTAYIHRVVRSLHQEVANKR